MTMMKGGGDLWPDERFDRAVRDMFRYKDGILEVRTPIAKSPVTPAKIAVNRG